MSADNLEESTEQLFLRFVRPNTENQAILFEEINKELEAFLTKESNDKDATDSALDLLSKISDSVQEEFDELISSHSDKKRFVRAMLKIFALLLNTRVDTAEKTNRKIKIAIETTIKIWQESRQQ